VLDRILSTSSAPLQCSAAFPRSDGKRPRECGPFAIIICRLIEDLLERLLRGIICVWAPPQGALGKPDELGPENGEDGGARTPITIGESDHCRVKFAECMFVHTGKRSLPNASIQRWDTRAPPWQQAAPGLQHAAPMAQQSLAK
jgi:hypothetical protein